MYFYIFHVLHSCYDPSVLLPDQRGFPRSSQEGSPTHSTHSKSAAQTLRWLKHLIIPRCILIFEPQCESWTAYGGPTIPHHPIFPSKTIGVLKCINWLPRNTNNFGFWSPESPPKIETDQRLRRPPVAFQAAHSLCQLCRKDVECWLCLVLFHHLYMCFNVFHFSSIVLSHLLCFKIHFKKNIKNHKNSQLGVSTEIRGPDWRSGQRVDANHWQEELHGLDGHSFRHKHGTTGARPLLQERACPSVWEGPSINDKQHDWQLTTKKMSKHQQPSWNSAGPFFDIVRGTLVAQGKATVQCKHCTCSWYDLHSCCIHYCITCVSTHRFNPRWVLFAIRPYLLSFMPLSPLA